MNCNTGHPWRETLSFTELGINLAEHRKLNLGSTPYVGRQRLSGKESSWTGSPILKDSKNVQPLNQKISTSRYNTMKFQNINKKEKKNPKIFYQKKKKEEEEERKKEKRRN